MIKVNRKPNGEVLGIPIFLGSDVIGKFVTEKTNYIEVTKTITDNGVLLEFEPIKINEVKGFREPVNLG